ncbi:MAG: hypothetical protein R3288_08370 [Woeseiaceae bacterium]|nr:hypothetical protein [Woeseiaceae bacterium]
MAETQKNPVSPPDAGEKRILDAIESRQVADFSALPDSERQVSAEFLQRLISGAGGTLCCPLRICGAHITGPLRPPTASLDGGRLAVLFRECHFDAPVDFSGAEFLVLRFVNCTLPAFIGASLRVHADLDLSGSQFAGVTDYESELSYVGTCAIHLNNARIGGKLDLSSTKSSRFSARSTVRLDGARIDGDVSLAAALLDGGGAAALSARAINVGNNVDLVTVGEQRFEANGEVIFAAAVISGDLSCEGGRLSNPNGRAMHCEDLQVESVFLTSSRDTDLPFEARGRLNFLTAIIGGGFFLTNARLQPGPDYDGLLKKGGPIALNLRQARISNALGLRNIQALDDDTPAPVKGWFLLTGMQVTTLLDNSETGWPAHGFLDLDGATYVRSTHVEGGDLVTKRLAWLRRQFPDGVPNAECFRPQPYEELARVLRNHGQTQEASAVAVEKIRMRLAARIDHPWRRVFPRTLMLISKHGYSTSRAVGSFIVFVLLGGAMYATAVFGFDQPFVPVENPPEPVTYTLAFGLAETTVEQGCPGLDVIHYALDAALPVIDVGQDLRCRFTPTGAWRGVWLLLHSVFVIIGAALSAIVVLTVTGVLRQD